jgi:hypothetical protein
MFRKGLLIIAALFIMQGLASSQDVPYVPTPQAVVEEMLSVAEVNENDMLYDLGCGDGRIVVTAARKYGTRGIGIDSNPKRIEESNANAESNGVTDKVEFRQEDLFQTDFSDATVVTLYLLTHVNLKLRPKLLSELKPGTRIVSHAFDMGDWEPEEVRDVDGRTIYFWRIPQNASGRWEGTNTGTNGENYVLNIDQNFQNINGNLQMNGKTYEIKNSKLENENIEFTLNDGTGEMKFSGSLRDNTLEGTLTGMNEGSDMNFNARRADNSMKPLDNEI